MVLKILQRSEPICIIFFFKNKLEKENYSSQKKMSSKDANYHKVIIIGAGVSGLSCAKHLSSNQINDYKILEVKCPKKENSLNEEKKKHPVS
jgi:NADPH-dependent glutamate synthase beta subunit-like oxidoreductase